MQIPGNPLLSGLGFIKQPPAASQPKTEPEAQAKSRPKVQSATLKPVDTLGQAVQTLSSRGSLPPRGSLVDFSA